MWSKFQHFLASNELHLALSDRKIEKAKQLINRNAKINVLETRYLGRTPLSVSLLYGTTECTLLLLEHKADPNAIDQNKESRGKTIQLYVDTENLSNIKLLVLYGANIDGVKFAPHTVYLKDFILGKNEVYKERIQAEQELNNPQAKRSKHIEACKKLQKLWEEQIQDEAEPIYKAHYQKKANEYKALAEKLEKEQTNSLAVTAFFSSPLVESDLSSVPLLGSTASSSSHKLKLE